MSDLKNPFLFDTKSYQFDTEISEDDMSKIVELLNFVKGFKDKKSLKKYINEII